MTPLKDTTHNLIYCSDARVDYAFDDDQNDSVEMRQVLAAQKILGVDLGMNVATYTQEDLTQERLNKKDDFEKGNLQALIAIRCLDEGVDIPLTKRALILASSTNPRQFIQRRGRVLRKAKGKDTAEIYDFIVFPSTECEDTDTFNVDRKMVKKELARFIEFCNIAINGPESSLVLLPIKKFYNLLEM